MALLNAKQLAVELNLKPAQVRRLALRGELPAYRYGDEWRFDLTQVLAATVHQQKLRTAVRNDLANWRLRTGGRALFLRKRAARALTN